MRYLTMLVPIFRSPHIIEMGNDAGPYGITYLLSKRGDSNFQTTRSLFLEQPSIAVSGNQEISPLSFACEVLLGGNAKITPQRKAIPR